MIFYKGEEGPLFLSWEVRAEASLYSHSHLPWGRAEEHTGFHLVLYSVNLCFPLNPISICISIIKTICNSCIASHFILVFWKKRKKVAFLNTKLSRQTPPSTWNIGTNWCTKDPNWWDFTFWEIPGYLCIVNWAGHNFEHILFSFIRSES